VPLTIAVSLSTILFTYIVAIPIGIYSATHQYSVGDHLFTGIGFIGLATPNFLLALALMYLSVRYLGGSVGGLFSREYEDAAWSVAKVWDLIKHLPIPVVVVGTAGTASIIRVMRATLLDEINKQYVKTARAKGVSEPRLLYKYPVRISINPLVSSMAWLFPAIISGGVIAAIVLNLPTVGPLLLTALRNQDMYLAGGIVMILGALTVVGTFVSDLLLVWLDPRIRLG
jgi:peptide/nickel transport system permease protein